MHEDFFNTVLEQYGIVINPTQKSASYSWEMFFSS